MGAGTGGAMTKRGMVLVVEDDLELRQSLIEILNDENFNTLEAADGREALELLKTTRPCLVLLDLMMPVVDGWQVLAEMRADPNLKTVPVCVITAIPQRAPEGALKVLKKPIALDDLLQVVEQNCGLGPTA
jgi:CheY-like chemotaxis protein